MAKTLVGAFDELSSAQNVLRELRTIGVPQDHMRLMDNNEARPDTETRPSEGEPSWTDRVSSWFSSLFDDDEDRRMADNYAEAWRRGHFLVVTDVESNQVDSVADIMNRYGAIDIDERAEHWRATGYAGTFDRGAAPYTPEQRKAELATYRSERTGGETIPVVQEELSVGKRIVRRGGVRIHSYVQEKPVEEVIRLREERVNVQRRPVNRPAERGDAAFEERTIEVSAEGEEPVVEKRARVVEEVSVGKNVEQRDQKIEETVRRKDVRVEPMPSSQNITPESRH
jgi:uncharacterized protein (TIGR02271 family)